MSGYDLRSPSYVTCPRATGHRFHVGGQVCLDCWWRRPWPRSALQPVGVHIGYERAGGSQWEWAQDARGAWFQKTTRPAGRARRRR